MNTDSVCAVFAYGTLKRGQCRQACWPAEPLDVFKAWTLGELTDTGPYPALFHGSDAVAGEVWIFDQVSMARVLEVLDDVEEYRPGQTATNLYEREIVRCTGQDGIVHRAHAYFYARPQEKSCFRRIEPEHVCAGRAYAVWPVGGDW